MRLARFIANCLGLIFGKNYQGMPTKQSHEIFADFYTDVPSGKSRMATVHGVHKDTATAWARPKPSDLNPSATGKGNPIDQTTRSMRVIHPHDPARAREIADHCREVCDELDREAGLVEAEEQGNPCKFIARLAADQVKLILTGLGGEYDPAKLREALKHTHSLKSNILQLESCIEKLLANEENE